MDKQLTSEILQKGEALIRDFAKTLGSTASHVYEVLVKQQFVEGVSMVLWIILMPLFILFIVKFFGFIFEKCKQNFEKGYDYKESCYFISGISTFIVGLFMFFTLMVAMDGIKRLINPEYYAIEFIVDSVQKKN